MGIVVGTAGNTMAGDDVKVGSDGMGLDIGLVPCGLTQAPSVNRSISKVYRLKVHLQVADWGVHKRCSLSHHYVISQLAVPAYLVSRCLHLSCLQKQ